MFNKINKFVMIALMICTIMSPLTLYAQENVSVEGLYAHPVSGVIEDSGGESSSALGQSMVTKMVNTSAIYDSSSNTIDITLLMMDSISDVNIQVQYSGASAYTNTSLNEVSRGNDQATYRVPMQSSSDIFRVEAFVLPMGRSVIFYIAVDGEFSIPTVDSTSGLVIKGPDANESDSQVTTDTIDANGIMQEIIIDDSFYLYAFLLLCAALVLSGAILIVFTIVLKSIFSNRRKLKEIRETKKQNVFLKEEINEKQEELNMQEIIKILEDDEVNETA